MNVQTIANLAIADITKATQNEKHHWNEAIRRDAEKKHPLCRIHLHGTLRTAAESFSKTHPQLAKHLREHLRHLDMLPTTREE